MVIFRIIVSLLLVFVHAYAQADETEKRLYRPFSSNADQDSAIVAAQVDGWCWEQSHVDTRGDAWRCADKNKVYDPCFVKVYGDRTQVICPTSPWDGQSVLIKLKHPLNEIIMKEMDMSRDYPWAVELSNGQKCQAIVGEKPIYDNMPIHYRCQNQAVLLGHLQRCKGTWQMLYKENSTVSTVEISRAWF